MHLSCVPRFKSLFFRELPYTFGKRMSSFFLPRNQEKEEKRIFLSWFLCMIDYERRIHRDFVRITLAPTPSLFCVSGSLAFRGNLVSLSASILMLLRLLSSLKAKKNQVLHASKGKLFSRTIEITVPAGFCYRFLLKSSCREHVLKITLITIFWTHFPQGK